MNNWLLYTSFSSLVFSWLCSLRSLSAGGNRKLRQFSFFLLFVVLGETFGILWTTRLHHLLDLSRNNQWFYNLFHLCSYLFLIYFFYQIIYHQGIRKVIRWLVIPFLLFSAINLAFFQGIMQLNTYTEILACFFMIFLSITYYYQLLYAKYVVSLMRDSFFWISTGMLIYHLGSAMGIFLINVMNAISNEKARSIHSIILFSAVIMYLNFSIAFLCQRKK
jgi:hypothetical protein